MGPTSSSLSSMAKAMKAMKAMKRVSIIAKNKRAKVTVFHGHKTKTMSGLTKADLFKNKRGKIVSRKASFGAKKRFANTIGGWSAALMKARKPLTLKGFVAVNGKTAQGRALYAKAKSFYSK